LLQQSKLFAVEVRLSIKTCKAFQALNCDKGKQQKEYADREAHGGANLCPGRQSGRHREREREREILRERRSDAGQGSRGSRQERERERKRPERQRRARQKSTQLAFHFSRSGLAWLIIVHWPGLDAVDNWALVTRVVP
jgi:hypothetical protein